MLKRKRTWFLLFALVGIALAVYFEPTRCVRGLLHGEAFFDGRPTSWWRGAVQRDLRIDPKSIRIWDLYQPPKICAWERFCQTVTGRSREYSSLRLAKSESEDADEVLRALTRDDDHRVSGFASDIFLETRTDIVELASSDTNERCWLNLIRKYHRPRGAD